MITPTSGGLWRRDDLSGRLAAALAFALEAIPHLRDSSTTAINPATEDPFLVRAKFVCETALVLLAAAKVPAPTPELKARIVDLTQALAPIARTEQTLAWMRTRPTAATELAVGHLCLTALGCPDPAFDDAYRAAVAGTDIGLAERVPWKDLEACWHRNLGAPAPALNWESTLRRTAYNQGIDVLHGSRETAYAFTHGLIYAADFGGRRPTITRPLEDVLADAEALTARCLDEDDFDLCAEVLLTWPYTRSAWTPGALFALHTMFDIVDACGVLPSMTLRADHLASLPPAAQARQYFQESYHTVYVFGLLLIAILRAGTPVPRKLPRASEARQESAQRLLDLIPPGRHPRQWESALQALPAPERGSLISLIAGAGARRAIRNGDLARAHEIVVVALHADAEPNSMISQTSDLLTRLSRTAA